MTDWGSEGRARAMCDEMAGRFHSILPPSWDFSSRACDARAFPGILHFLLSQPSHLVSRSHSFQIGIISPTFQKKRRRFLEKRWSFSKKRRRFFHISRTFFLCWSDSFRKLSCHSFPFLMHFSTTFLLFFWKILIYTPKSLLMRSPSILYKDFCEGCESKKCKIAVVCAHACA